MGGSPLGLLTRSTRPRKPKVRADETNRLTFQARTRAARAARDSLAASALSLSALSIAALLSSALAALARRDSAAVGFAFLIARAGSSSAFFFLDDLAGLGGPWEGAFSCSSSGSSSSARVGLGLVALGFSLSLALVRVRVRIRVRVRP